MAEGEAEKSVVPRKFQPFPFEYHTELTLRVEALTNRGIGVCRTSIPNLSEDPRGSNKEESENDDKEDGWVIFVPNVIPGELVTCRIYRNYKSYSDADLVSIDDPSPNRVDPVCPLSSECGGCQYQHMNIESQREWKTSQVQELLERIGKLEKESFPPVLPTVGTNEVYNYRSKITPHYDRARPGNDGRLHIKAIGFKKKANRQLVDVPECHIATEAINNKLTELREAKFLEANEGRLKRPKKGATLLLRDAHRFSNDNESEESVVENDPNVYVKTKVKDLTFRFLAGNFFQNNPYMLPVMVDYVVGPSIQPNAEGNKMTHFIDCYCGSGLFCINAAAHFDVCVGIEVNEKAVEEAQMNAEINSIGNCKFVAASAEAIFESKTPVKVKKGGDKLLVKDFPRETTVVCVDPPRKGCSEEFLSQLYTFGPQRVVYMSCDPATQARDAEGIVAAGYRIVSSQPFDLFPQTRHIENLVIFEKI